MHTLYHYPLCPKSRLIRVLFDEHQIEYRLEKVDYWKEKKKLENIDPLGKIPIIRTTRNFVISGFYPAAEYVADLFPHSHLIPSEIEQKAEMRRIITWLNERFDTEVTNYILNEKLIKLISHEGNPRTEFLRAARVNFLHHINYFQTLFAKFGNISSNIITIADVFLACHLSCMDYFGEVNWEKLHFLKEWYAPIKSRPSFRKLLSDRVSVLSPPSYYENPDF